MPAPPGVAHGQITTKNTAGHHRFSAAFEPAFTVVAALQAAASGGVRGIMMLTLPTAQEMGVESRLDAAQSIMGGAKYLRRQEQRIPDSVTGQDRWWSALAAYNVGMGHLSDARQQGVHADR